MIRKANTTSFSAGKITQTSPSADNNMNETVITMPPIPDQAWQLAQLAVQMIRYTDSSRTLPFRCREAVTSAAGLLTYCMGIGTMVDEIQARTMEEILFERYCRSESELRKLSDTDLVSIDEIIGRFESLAPKQNLLNPSTFFAGVLYPGTRHKLTTFEKAWEAYGDREVGSQLPLNYRSAVLHGLGFVKMVKEKLSTLAKHQETMQTKTAK